MTERDRPRRGSHTRPKATPGGATRPREAPRPDRSTPSGRAEVVLSAPTFVSLSADEERQAVGALAELLVPVVVRTGLQPTDPEPPAVTANGDA